MSSKILPRKYRWYHGLVFLIVVNLLTFSWLFVDTQYYEVLNKPVVAPPSWVFGPVWFVNNLLVIWGNLKVLNSPKSPDRNIFLGLQGLSWVNYVLFTYLTFGLKVPAMFFWATFPMWLLTVVSIYFGYKVDKLVPWSFVTLLPWLTLASYLGLFVWLNN